MSTASNLRTWIGEALASERWITIKSSAGTAHICLDGDGTITKGPAGLVGTNIAHLPPPQGNPERAAEFGRNVHDKFHAYVKEHYDEARAEYTKRFGNVLNTDYARELSPEYNRSKVSRSALAAAVQRGAGSLMKRMFYDALQEATPADKNKMVVFTGGGAGSGKSTAVSSIPTVKSLVRDAKLVSDGTMKSFSDSVSMIDAALDSGHKVTIVYIHRDPVESFAHGVLPRAEETGRTVPLDIHAAGHLGAAQTIHRLADHYQYDTSVTVIAIDNSGGMGQQTVVPLSTLRTKVSYTERGLRDRLLAIREDAYHGRNGQATISERVYAGTKPLSPVEDG